VVILFENQIGVKLVLPKKVVKERKSFEVFIPKGARHQQKIVFTGEADQEPGGEAGDIILILSQKEHPVFKRAGDDLQIEQSIPLVQALTGCCFLVKHLDGRQLLVKTNRGEVITPGEIRVIEGEGMPIQRTTDKGNLLVKINIVFPASGSLSEPQLKQIEKLLPSNPPIKTNNLEVEEVNLTKLTSTHQQRGRREAYEDLDEDDDHPGASRVQCAQQ